MSRRYLRIAMLVGVPQWVLAVAMAQQNVR